MPASRRKLLVVTAGGVALILVLGALIGELTEAVVDGDGITRLDPHVTDWIVRHRVGLLDTAARAVTRLGNPAWVTGAMIAAAVLFALLSRFRLSIMVIVSSLGAGAITASTKVAVGRARPEEALRMVHAGGFSFPSGHATQAVALWAATAAGLVLVVRTRRARIALVALGVLLALAIGMSRIYLGVHWASDVLGGWAVGSIWLILALLVEWSMPRIWVELKALRGVVADRP